VYNFKLNASVDCVIVANCWIEAQAYGWFSVGNLVGFVKLNNVAVWEAALRLTAPNLRGVNILLVELFNCSLLESRNFDTGGSTTAASELSTYLRQVNHGVIIVGVTAEEPTSRLANDLPALQQLGVDVSDVRHRGSFVFVAQKGFPAKTKLHKTLNERESERNQPRLSVNITGINRNNSNLWKLCEFMTIPRRTVARVRLHATSANVVFVILCPHSRS